MSSPTYPAWVRVVQSQMAKGTSRHFARVCASNVFPLKTTACSGHNTSTLGCKELCQVVNSNDPLSTKRVHCGSTRLSNVNITLTWTGWAQEHNVALLKLNFSVGGVQHIAAPPFLWRLLVALLLHGCPEGVAMGTDPSNLQQFWINKISWGVFYRMSKNAVESNWISEIWFWENIMCLTEINQKNDQYLLVHMWPNANQTSCESGL